jgi:hypothetical protein
MMSFGENQNVNIANNMVSASNAQTGNASRRARNLAAMAEGGLQRFIQSLNNNRQLQEGADALSTAQTNFNRSVGSAKQSMFSDDIAQAEQRGAAAVAQAASGTGGSVADAVNAATALRNQITSEIKDDRLTMLTSDQRARMGSIASQMIGGLDSSVIHDNIDYSKDVPTVKAVKSMANIFVSTVVSGAAGWLTGGGFGGKPKEGQGVEKGKSAKGAESNPSSGRYETSMGTQAKEASFTWNPNSDYESYL